MTNPERPELEIQPDSTHIYLPLVLDFQALDESALTDGVLEDVIIRPVDAQLINHINEELDLKQKIAALQLQGCTPKGGLVKKHQEKASVIEGYAVLSGKTVVKYSEPSQETTLQGQFTIEELQQARIFLEINNGKLSIMVELPNDKKETIEFVFLPPDQPHQSTSLPSSETNSQALFIAIKLIPRG